MIAVDIGNTTTSFGVFEGGRLRTQFSIATQPWRAPDEIALQLKALVIPPPADLPKARPGPAVRLQRTSAGGGTKTRQLHLAQAEQILVCSVVPRMSSVLVEALKSLQAIPIRVIGQDVQVPLKNCYTYPEQVGQDRLVGTYAALQRHKRDCIVVDFGTAITIDIVTKAGEYLGGIITPGLEISMEALAMKTALLPKVELKEPPELLGKDTANSIRSGILYGCVALCDGLVTQFKRRYAPNAVVVATGGASALVAKHAKTIDHLEPHLVLEGLCRLSTLQASTRTKTVKPRKR